MRRGCEFCITSETFSEEFLRVVPVRKENSREPELFREELPLVPHLFWKYLISTKEENAQIWWLDGGHVPVINHL